MIPSPSSLRAVELLALSSIFKTPYVRTLRQAVDLPSQDEMEDDECEHPGHSTEYGGRFASPVATSALSTDEP